MIDNKIKYNTDSIDALKYKSCDTSNRTLDTLIESETEDDEIIAGKYHVMEELGNGSFGVVRRAFDKKGNEYAIKFEPMEDYKKHLHRENVIYDTLANYSYEEDFAKKYYYGDYKDHRVLVLDRLGKTLKYYFYKYHRIFDLETVSNIAVQILHRLEQLHDIGWLHQDIKPENILVDRQNKKKLYLVDFGTSAIWRIHNKHVEYERAKKIVGSARYSSITNHNGYIQSRKDDLESLGYVLLYLMNGTVPWQNMKGKNIRIKWKKIGKMKMNMNIKHVCKKNNLPSCFLKYFLYVQGLSFNEKPNYMYLRILFQQYVKHDFFWSKN